MRELKYAIRYQSRSTLRLWTNRESRTDGYRRRKRPRRSRGYQAVLATRRSATADPLDRRVSEVRPSRLLRSTVARGLLRRDRILAAFLLLDRHSPVSGGGTHRQ